MWIEKLSGGVLELDTPAGARYVEPNLVERVYLIWTFRNFFSLPEQVLRPWERRLIDSLWSRNNFVSRSAIGEGQRPIIGRVEGSVAPLAPARAEILPIRKPASSSKPAVTDQSREAASA